MIVSIHQPQYLPWAAYMYKVMMSDVFVLFDTVQYARGHGNRNMIKAQHGPIWLTVPIHRKGTGTTFKDTLVQDELDWARRHSAALNSSYQKARGWSEIAADMKALYDAKQWSSISDVDEAFLRLLIEKLKLGTKLVRASDLYVDPATHSGSDYLIAIIRAVGGDRYISGKGAGSMRYVSQATFDAARIELMTYDFVSPVYTQLWGDFIPDLSIIDVIASRGLEDTRRIMETSGKLIPWPSDA